MMNLWSRKANWKFSWHNEAKWQQENVMEYSAHTHTHTHPYTIWSWILGTFKHLIYTTVWTSSYLVNLVIILNTVLYPMWWPILWHILWRVFECTCLLHWNRGLHIWDCTRCKIVKGLNIDVNGCRK